ncbi:aa3-type cytochrome c oxidase subunit IV [Aquabacter spiritensis]|uniref:Aa3 type cytochrome c oxidase subunit IV n=1 Tax=Aquabacter spiritensis TaxID=933073 RepID=A0A4R3M4H9_9HYPH|nr:aa3-type cytochrome c oxidase subunit IV [Aquabacter spiritensis]TCT07746.1 aa3 type cytochrome c oxidase subunit IV [Aquabacter spiritensis]
MADHGTLEYTTAQGNDYEEHARTYALFTTMTKWSTIALAILMVFMWFFLL